MLSSLSNTLYQTCVRFYGRNLLGRLRRDDRGWTPFQIILALIIIGSLVSMSVHRIAQLQSRSTQTTYASRHETIRAAALNYADDFFSTLFASLQVEPRPITIETLLATDKITPSITTLVEGVPEVFNGNGDRHVVVGRIVGTRGVELFSYATGGRDLPATVTSAAVRALGDNGGLVYAGEENCGAGIDLCAIGRQRGWFVNWADFDSTLTADIAPVPGNVATLTFVGDPTQDSPFLYTHPQADPARNSLFTDVDWNGNNLLDVGDIQLGTLNMQVSHGLILYSAIVAPDTAVDKPVDQCAAVGGAPDLLAMFASAAAAGGDEGLPMSQISVYHEDDPVNPTTQWRVRLKVTSENIAGGTPASDVGRIAIIVKCS